MSKQANPIAVGAFLLGALTLLVVGVLMFGGSDWFKPKKRFVIFFNSALNGLNIGAPVKLQGVQIGNVAEISLEIDAATGRILKPVVIEIEPQLLRDFSVEDTYYHTEDQHKKDAQRLIDAGLKARLETQSLLTGLLYVDLNFYHDKPLNLVNIGYKNLPELPSVPTTVDEIRNTVDEIIKRARQLPVEEMLKTFTEALQESRDFLKSEDMKKSIAGLSKSLQETQQLMKTLNTQVTPLLSNVNITVTETRTSLQDFNKQLLPVLKAAEQSLLSATLVLQDSQQTLNSVETFTSPDSPLGQALLEMRDASRSIKDLTETLERKPQAIIYGK